MAMIEKVGHDKRGNVTFKRDEEGNEILVPDLAADEESGKAAVSRKAKVVDDETLDAPGMFREFKRLEGIRW
jgi:type I restriction enzyme M protein